MERDRRGMSGVLSSLSLLCVILDLQLDGSLAASQAEIENHLEMGRKLLAAGQLAEALSHYHSAVDGDPKNYLTYYKRATVYLAMGKFKSALPDLSKAIDLKPDFLAARLQRGNILLKQGDTQDAEEDFRAVLLSSPTNEEAKNQLDRVREVQERREEAWAAYDREDYGEAISLLEKVIEFSPWDPSVRELRSECYLRIGDLNKAIQDLKPTTKLRNDNRAAFLKLSRLYYTMGEHEESLSQVRECLKLDQDDKDCFSHYKQVKKLSRQLESAEELIRDQRYEAAVEKFEAAIKTEPNVEIYRKQAKERICHCLSKSQHTEAAIRTCTEAHQRDPHNPQVLKDRAEAYILNEDYEKAVEDFQQAKELDGGERGNKGRSGESSETAQTIPETRLLQNPGREEKRQQTGSDQSIQEVGTAVAPRQLSVRGGKKRSREEIHRYCSCQRSVNRPSFQRCVRRWTLEKTPSGPREPARLRTPPAMAF
ncbi:unnamed protein product [Staurois parvus]|uniref:Uncharacterized protein n=1 Tax=Staurois parvus TaxID=386267 RepID=A0ABN9F581_9NEOB|nr:unnamed protein product [Staurois parvus]